MRLRFSRFLKKLLRHGLLPQGQVGWVWGIPIRPAVVAAGDLEGAIGRTHLCSLSGSASGEKPAPLIETSVPPAAGPDSGVTPVTLTSAKTASSSGATTRSPARSIATS